LQPSAAGGFIGQSGVRRQFGLACAQRAHQYANKSHPLANNAGNRTRFVLQRVAATASFALDAVKEWFEMNVEMLTVIEDERLDAVSGGGRGHGGGLIGGALRLVGNVVGAGLSLVGNVLSGLGGLLGGGHHR
jgi:hypothetical protein